ncbi:glycosyltransferase family 2 protein [Roseospira marina]|uniref:Glycosyltransferase family 2 protein n=1 Tax=Roseospira marina TaxID=140057 RepID=A0A5M6IAZ9_9PROT|nr:glycosyltransferase family 2 protein [Roseospira marina]KAA5605137.1 glycosyltransferase family 2 protein [Roseospira marina]MBB4314891.1 GT2 family glycosyltransferase [Roseospira marina]MBB5087891.1 GT2 family glycosyltransferase [Roseospira marina]
MPVATPSEEGASQPGPWPLVSVLMVSHDSQALARRAFDHLAVQDRDDFEVILVENGRGGADWAYAEAERRAFPITVLHPGANLGFAAGNNLAAEYARGGWLALLNPDAYPDPDWLSALLAAAARHPAGTAFGSVQLDAGHPSRLDGIGDCWCPAGLAWRGGYRAPVETAPPADVGVFGPCAAAALWSRADFDALGGFEARFFCYMEDVDLALRHRLRGGRCVTVAAARVRHVGSASTARRHAFNVYHDRRNALWTVVRTTPAVWFWPLVPLQIAAHALMLARAARHGLFRDAFRGLRDGLAGLGGPTGVWAQRQRIQAERTVSLRNLARALTWSPLALLTRRARSWDPAREAPRAPGGEAGRAS